MHCHMEIHQIEGMAMIIQEGEQDDLLVAWYRRASAQGKVVRFSNVPADLRKIIDVSGLEDLLL